MIPIYNRSESLVAGNRDTNESSIARDGKKTEEDAAQ